MPERPKVFRFGNGPTRKQQGDKARGSAASRGYNRRWAKVRRLWLDLHPLCADCEAIGRTNLASEVHHTVKPKGDDEVFWDESLWLGLCKSHHSARTARGE